MAHKTFHPSEWPSPIETNVSKPFIKLGLTSGPGPIMLKRSTNQWPWFELAKTLSAPPPKHWFCRRENDEKFTISSVGSSSTTQFLAWSVFLFLFHLPSREESHFNCNRFNHYISQKTFVDRSFLHRQAVSSISTTILFLRFRIHLLPCFNFDLHI